MSSASIAAATVAARNRQGALIQARIERSAVPIAIAADELARLATLEGAKR